MGSLYLLREALLQCLVCGADIFIKYWAAAMEIASGEKAVGRNYAFLGWESRIS
jgi:hypothetical protein